MTLSIAKEEKINVAQTHQRPKNNRQNTKKPKSQGLFSKNLCCRIFLFYKLSSIFTYSTYFLKNIL